MYAHVLEYYEVQTCVSTPNLVTARVYAKGPSRSLFFFCYGVCLRTFYRLHRPAGGASLQAEGGARGRRHLWRAVPGPQQRHPPPRPDALKHLRRGEGTQVIRESTWYVFVNYVYT